MIDTPRITAHAIRTDRSAAWPAPTPGDIDGLTLAELSLDREYAQVIGWTEGGEVVMTTWYAGAWWNGDRLPVGAE